MLKNKFNENENENINMCNLTHDNIKNLTTFYLPAIDHLKNTNDKITIKKSLDKIASKKNISKLYDSDGNELMLK